MTCAHPAHSHGPLHQSQPGAPLFASASAACGLKHLCCCDGSDMRTPCQSCSKLPLGATTSHQPALAAPRTPAPLCFCADARSSKAAHAAQPKHCYSQHTNDSRCIAKHKHPAIASAAITHDRNSARVGCSADAWRVGTRHDGVRALRQHLMCIAAAANAVLLINFCTGTSLGQGHSKRCTLQRRNRHSAQLVPSSEHPGCFLDHDVSAHGQNLITTTLAQRTVQDFQVSDPCAMLCHCAIVVTS